MTVTDLDAFRLELGDRDSNDPLFNDTEAQYFIDKRPGRILLAVADACESLARRFSRMVDTTIKSADDSVSRKWSDMAKGYAAQAKELRARDRSENPGAPWHGGGSKARKDDLASDTDRVQAAFKRGEFDGASTGLG